MATVEDLAAKMVIPTIQMHVLRLEQGHGLTFDSFWTQVKEETSEMDIRKDGRQMVKEAVTLS